MVPEFTFGSFMPAHFPVVCKVVNLPVFADFPTISNEMLTGALAAYSCQEGISPEDRKMAEEAMFEVSNLTNLTTCALVAFAHGLAEPGDEGDKWYAFASSLAG